MPQLQHHPLDDALDEIERLGFAMCNPFELVEDDVFEMWFVRARPWRQNKIATGK